MDQPYVRREARVKAEVLQLVEHSPLPVRQTLKEVQIAASTYYRWRRRYAEQGLAGLEDLPPVPRKVWNKLKEEERQYVVAYALEQPALSSREVATRLVDTKGRFIFEATVYRILKEAGLIQPPETKGFPAGKEYQVKTHQPNELWHTDASYCFVVGWGYYYLISVLDDYSRMILGWKVQPRMSSPDIIEVVQEAIEFTGQPAVPVEAGPALLTDHGPGFLSRLLEEFLMLRAMKHIVASPFHPQTNGKLERYHRTAKAKVNLFVYHSPEALGEAMGSFVNYYNYHRYHEALDNVTPADVYYGCREEILARREKVKQQTLAARRAANLSTA
jgi:putative transposase